MTFMTRVLLFSLLTLSNCSSFDLGYFDIVRGALKTNKIENLEPFIANKFSFIRLTKGKNQAILVLSDYDNGIETWVGSGEETLVTAKGVILFSDGLEYNVQQHEPIVFQENIYLNRFSTYTSFDRPSLKYVQSIYIKQNSKHKKRLDCKGASHSYKRTIESIRYKDDLIICLNENQIVESSVQKIHPWDEEIKIEFFYM